MGERESTNTRARRACAVVGFSAKSPVLLLAVCAGLLGFAHTARATPLSTLLQPGASISFGDKTFTNFTTTVTGFGQYFYSDANVDVQPTVDLSGNIGLIFQGMTAPLLTAMAGSFADVLIRFDVTAQKPNWIHDLNLSFTPSGPTIDGNGHANGYAQVVETASFNDPQNGNLPVIVGQTQVDFPLPPGELTSHVDLLSPTPGNEYYSIHVLKDVFVLGGSDIATSIGSITQTFSQLPEPTTLAFLGFGSLVACAGARRRTRRIRLVGTGGVSVLLAILATAAISRPVAATTLATLASPAAPGFIVEGDKRFDNFAYSVDENVGITVFNATAIDITGRTFSANDIGLEFAGVWAALSSAQANSKLVVTISFDVTVVNDPRLIHDLALQFNGGTTLDSSVSIDETATVNAVPVGHVVADTSALPGSLMAHTDLNGTYPSIHVTKVITINGGQSGVGTISYIQQRFSQTPEPASLTGALLGLPLLIRRRKTA